MEVNTAIITITTALLGVLCGAAAGAYFNFKSARKDLIFKRKLDYFEKLSQDMEKNIRLYRKVILSLSNSSKLKGIKANLLELKENRKNFLVVASPLYFDIGRMRDKITSFVDVEKDIFSNFENLADTKSKSSKTRGIFELNESLQKLEDIGETIVDEMKMELHQR